MHICVASAQQQSSTKERDWGLYDKAGSWWPYVSMKPYHKERLYPSDDILKYLKGQCHINIQDKNLAIRVPADGLTPIGARPSAGIMLNINKALFCQSFFVY